MTSTTILPSTGAPPPNLARPPVPAHLRPHLPDPVEKLTERRQEDSAPRPQGPETTGKAEGGERGGGSGRAITATAAVRLQLIESAVPPTTQEITQESPSSSGPTDEDKAELARLAARDQEVRTHEAAHQTAGAGFAGAPSFEYTRGPDGRQYAVGGHVQIDTRPVPDNPAATISKMEIVRRAALAPARPSGQDRAVAADAAVKIQEAEAQQAAQRQAEREQVRSGQAASSVSGLSGGSGGAESGQILFGPAPFGQTPFGQTPFGQTPSGGRTISASLINLIA